MNRGPTVDMIVDLCARLRMATEAIGADSDSPILPEHVSLDDVSQMERARLRRLGQRDLWALINQSNSVALPPPAKRDRAGAA